MTTSTNSRSRTRRDIIFRAASRKNSCARILYFNIAFMIILIIAIYSCINYAIFAFKVMSRDRKDKPMMSKYADLFDQYECPYKKPGNYSLEYCSKYCGNNSMITRMHLLDKDSEGWYIANKDKASSCMNKIEALDCHESLTQAHHKCLPLNENITQCAGMHGSHIINKTDDHNAIVPAVPKISAVWVKEKKVVLANELIIHCPTCLKVSENFSVRFAKISLPGCYAKLATKVKGWPGSYEYCDNTLKTSDTETCTLVKKND